MTRTTFPRRPDTSDLPYAESMRRPHRGHGARPVPRELASPARIAATFGGES